MGCASAGERSGGAALQASRGDSAGLQTPGVTVDAVQQTAICQCVCLALRVASMTVRESRRNRYMVPVPSASYRFSRWSAETRTKIRSSGRRHDVHSPVPSASYRFSRWSADRGTNGSTRWVSAVWRQCGEVASARRHQTVSGAGTVTLSTARIATERSMGAWVEHAMQWSRPCVANAHLPPSAAPPLPYTR